MFVVNAPSAPNVCCWCSKCTLGLDMALYRSTCWEKSWFVYIALHDLELFFQVFLCLLFFLFPSAVNNHTFLTNVKSCSRPPFLQSNDIITAPFEFTAFFQTQLQQWKNSCSNAHIQINGSFASTSSRSVIVDLFKSKNATKLSEYLLLLNSKVYLLLNPKVRTFGV